MDEFGADDIDISNALLGEEQVTLSSIPHPGLLASRAVVHPAISSSTMSIEFPRHLLKLSF